MENLLKKAILDYFDLTEEEYNSLTPSEKTNLLLTIKTMEEINNPYNDSELFNPELL